MTFCDTGYHVWVGDVCRYCDCTITHWCGCGMTT